MKKTDIKNLILILLIVILAVAAFGCSKGGASGAAAGSRKNEGEPGDYKIPKFRNAVFNESMAYGNNEVRVDLSSVSLGYIALKCNSDARVKLQVVKGNDTYTYDVTQGKTQIFPLQSGNGSYQIKVMKNISGNKYYELYSTPANVSLKDKFQPYTRPNQYADYSKKSKCVKEARKLAKQATCESDFVSKVYEYVCRNVKYDYDEVDPIRRTHRVIFLYSELLKQLLYLSILLPEYGNH